MNDYRVAFTHWSGCESASVEVRAKNKRQAKWLAYQEASGFCSCYEGFIDFCRHVYMIEKI